MSKFLFGLFLIVSWAAVSAGPLAHARADADDEGGGGVGCKVRLYAVTVYRAVPIGRRTERERARCVCGQ